MSLAWGVFRVHRVRGLEGPLQLDHSVECLLLQGRVESASEANTDALPSDAYHSLVAGACLVAFVLP
jgi:hypothetical protein